MSAVEFGAIATIILAIATVLAAVITALSQRKPKETKETGASPAPPHETPIVQPVNAAIVEKSNSSAEVLRNEGDEYRKLGKNAEALEKYRAAAELEPDDAQNHDKIAEVLNELGRNNEALEENIKAVARETNPTRKAQFYRHKADTLLNLKREENAVTDLREATRLAPNNAAYHHDLGMYLQKLHRREEAVPPLRKATELSPDNAAYQHDLGTYLRRRCRDEEAVPPLKKATELAPDNAAYHYDLGMCLQWLHRYEEAVPPLKKAAELAPDNGYYKDDLRQVERALKQSPA